MVDRKLLYRWCSIRVEDLENHPDLKLPFRLVKNSEEIYNILNNIKFNIIEYFLFNINFSYK